MGGNVAVVRRGVLLNLVGVHVHRLKGDAPDFRIPLDHARRWQSRPAASPWHVVEAVKDGEGELGPRRSLHK